MNLLDWDASDLSEALAARRISAVELMQATLARIEAVNGKVNAIVLLGDRDTLLAEAQAALLTALRACAAHWVIVSNEVGQGIVPENAMARQFREAQGRLNIALAAEADTVVQVVVGLPQLLKGEMP